MSPRMAAVRRGLPPAAGIPAPADRRFRRSDLRLSRGHGFRQVAWRVGRWVIGGGLVGALLVWGGSAVVGSSLMRVSHILVRGNARLSVGEVEALVDGIRGESILSVNFDRYRRRLMDSPWVAGASMWRVLPSTVEVRVVERTPLVIARIGQQLYLVDDQGVIIDEFGPQYRQYDLPIAEGLVTTHATAGPAVEPERVRLADRLIRGLDAYPALRERLSQIDVTNPRDAVVLLEGDPAFLHLGDGRFAERLAAYLELAPALRERFAGIDYVDLRFDERIYVRSKKREGTVALGKR